MGVAVLTGGVGSVVGVGVASVVGCGAVSGSRCGVVPGSGCAVVGGAAPGSGFGVIGRVVSGSDSGVASKPVGTGVGESGSNGTPEGEGAGDIEIREVGVLWPHPARRTTTVKATAQNRVMQLVDFGGGGDPSLQQRVVSDLELVGVAGLGGDEKVASSNTRHDRTNHVSG